MTDEDKKGADKKGYKDIAAFSAVGITLGVSIGGGAYVGYLLDKKFDTAPWLTLLCLLLGIVAGFKNLFDTVKKYDNRNNRPPK